MKVRQIRETVFQQLFMAEFYSRSEKPDQSDLFLTDEDLLQELELSGEGESFTEEERALLKERFLAVSEQIPVLDEKLNAVSEGWKTDRMPKSDLCILRLAAYEILVDEKIPDRVAVNEAVELAKKYGGENASFSFINAVLGKIIREKGE